MEKYGIIRKPLITEKATIVKEKDNVYVFSVDTSATKSQIKKAVEEIFNVKVQKVRTATAPGKFRRMGAYGGYKSDVKKAYVSIVAGQMIKVGE